MQNAVLTVQCAIENFKVRVTHWQHAWRKSLAKHLLGHLCRIFGKNPATASFLVGGVTQTAEYIPHQLGDTLREIEGALARLSPLAT